MSKSGKRAADDRLLMALACGATVENAARAANVSESTAYRRRKDPEFCQRLQDLRTEMVERTAGVLTAAASEAVKTLLALQKDNVAAGARLGAARTILEFGIKLRELVELGDRLAELEKRLLILHKRESLHAA